MYANKHRQLIINVGIFVSTDDSTFRFSLFTTSYAPRFYSYSFYFLQMNGVKSILYLKKGYYVPVCKILSKSVE